MRGFLRFPKKENIIWENFIWEVPWKKKTLYKMFSKKKTPLTSSSNPLPQVSHPILRSNNTFTTQYISIKQSRLPWRCWMKKNFFGKRKSLKSSDENILQKVWCLLRIRWGGVRFRRLFHSSQCELNSKNQPFRLWFGSMKWSLTQVIARYPGLGLIINYDVFISLSFISYYYNKFK